MKIDQFIVCFTFNFGNQFFLIHCCLGYIQLAICSFSPLNDQIEKTAYSILRFPYKIDAHHLFFLFLSEVRESADKIVTNIAFFSD